MVVTQSAAAAASAAVLGGVGARTARWGSGSEGGAPSFAAAQIAPRSTRPGAHPISISSPLWRFKVTGDGARASSATRGGGLPAVEEGKEIEIAEESHAKPVPEASISAFMADVANLVKLVDSRDIFELELKHKEYEIVIRKEAQQPAPPPTTFPGPHVMAHTSFPGYATAPPPVLVPGPSPSAAEPAPAPVASTIPVPPAKPSHPPMLSPMAGTFYRSPAPGEPALVQVGDKVSKGQVLCIVEAMKLMNEIEADQSGTIIEIVAEDGKPISIESPLFVIKP